MKTAIIAGATGLVGRQLLKQLLSDEYFKEIRVFVRRSTGIKDPKLKEYIVDFNRMDEWKKEVSGDILFSAMGTTMKQAGSKAAMRMVDYSFQLGIAKCAADNGVPDYCLVSTPGASPKSLVFYTRIRGELDRDVKTLGFDRIMILKPSVLLGKREKERKAEAFWARMIDSLSFLPVIKSYRSIEGSIVAKAMINAVKKQEDIPVREYKLDKIFNLAEE